MKMTFDFCLVELTDINSYKIDVFNTTFDAPI